MKNRETGNKKSYEIPGIPETGIPVRKPIKKFQLTISPQL